MPKKQMDTISAVSHHLPEIAKQLRIANELKAPEMSIVHCKLNAGDWGDDTYAGGYRSISKRIDDIMEN